MKVLFVVQEGPDSGITVYANNIAKVLRKKKVAVSIDEKFSKGYDIIHIHGRPHLGILTAKIKGNPKIVTTTHVTPKELEGLMPDHLMWVADTYLKGLQKLAKKIFVTAPSIMKELEKKKSIKHKLVFLPYPVDVNRFMDRKDIKKDMLRKKFNIPKKRKVVICVASVQKRKGIFDFVEIAKKLPKYTFVWVGKIPDGMYLKNRGEIETIVAGNKPENLIFAGPLFGDKLVEALYSANLFWLPSKSETFGLVVVEAASSGLNVLLRDLPAYEPFKEFALTYKSKPEEKIIDLVECPKEYEKLKKKAKIAVKRYDVERHADTLIKEYEEVIGKGTKFLEKKYSKQKMPLVSIIVPTLNEEKFVARTLKSLINQTVPKKFYEIIVSDSSSNDGTVKIAKKYADKVVVCKRKSAGFGRNFGAKHASGKFIGFVDADTIVSKTWVEGLIEGLEKGIAVTGPMQSLEKDSKRLNAFFKFWDAQTRTSINLKYPIFPGFNFGARKKEFMKAKGFRTDNVVVEDMDLSLRLNKKGKAVFNKKMSVKTSTRRVKEIPIFDYMMNATRYALTGKSWGWEKHRKDFE